MQQNSKLNTILTIILGVLILFTLYISYYTATYTVTEIPAEEPIPTHRGSLTLTLQPLVPASAKAGVYTYSFGADEPTVKNAENDYFAAAFSSDERVSVVTNDENGESQLFISDINNHQDPEAFTPPSPALFPGASQWSKDNTAVVYDALTARPSDEDWAIEYSRVVYLDVETGEQVIVDEGTSPVFQNDNSILYLKTDGVYYARVIDMKVEGIERVIAFDEAQSTALSRIALSPDEELLAVTHPDISLVEVYHQVTLEDGTRVPDLVFADETIAFWPVFSPDRKSLAYIQIINKDGEVASKAIAVYDIETGTSERVFDLKQYTEQFLSLTSWTK